MATTGSASRRPGVSSTISRIWPWCALGRREEVGTLDPGDHLLAVSRQGGLPDTGRSGSIVVRHDQIAGAIEGETSLPHTGNRLHHRRNDHLRETVPDIIAIAATGETVVGDRFCFIAEDAKVEATRQTAIDSFLINTGPVEMTFQYAGPFLTR